jgi:hypothetical protein
VGGLVGLPTMIFDFVRFSGDENFRGLRENRSS